ncbi:uncharacterized protein si:ch73-345f18.3 isoform X1 [Danio rerio]|uniref:Si:ch73-345f18.3 n=1 Tax=Danio rerio TaxID=7955 RepID=A0A0R4IBM4_DANRE|nr:uncharacterized protein si:ch73-345f18.3 [Danio rerio]|eukprot:XP_002664081.2 uncharacterized protein si:ch73-345f18.3 [Danio rerio]
MGSCCCCCSSPNEDGESEPLLRTNSKTESARPLRPTANDAGQKSGRFLARHVGINDLDERFRDVAETFNKQQEHYETMKDTLQNLANHYKCPSKDSLSQCLKKIKQDHELQHISLEVKGYDFSLTVRSDTEISSGLKRTQESIAEMSKAAKAVISVATKLQEMMDWLLKEEESMIQRVEAAESRHQEQRRLLDNLKKNLVETRRAKELSPKYRKEAGNLLNEAAVLSGITP